MLFEDKNIPLKDVPWYVWLFYLVGTVAFFGYVFKRDLWCMFAFQVLFFGGSYLARKARKQRPPLNE